MSGSSKIASELKSNDSEKSFIIADSPRKYLQKVGVHAIIKLFSESLDFNSDAIFELPDIDLDNRILISSQNSDLKKSTSSTARPKLQTACARPLIGQIGQKMVCDLMVGPYSHGVAKKAQLEKKYFRALPSEQQWKKV